jgi:hypothetical protein
MSASAWSTNEGRILVVGFAGGRIPSVPANRILIKNCSIVGVDYGTEMDGPPALRTRLTEVFSWYAQGRLKPHISARLPLNEAGAALRLLAARAAHGKIALEMWDDSHSGRNKLSDQDLPSTEPLAGRRSRFPKSDNKAARNNERATDKDRSIRTNTEEQQIYKLRSQEEQHDINAQQAPKIGRRNMAKNAQRSKTVKVPRSCVNFWQFAP